MSTGADHLVVFYDGTCPFCIGWVKFLLDRDGDDRLRFASLQSNWSKAFFREHGLGQPGLESVLVWDGRRLHSRSEAIAELGAALPGIWGLGRHLRAIPIPMRENSYRWIARNRHRWFGQRENCWLPDAGERRKFLDLDDPVYQDSANEAAPDIPPDPDPGKRDP